jgi:ubiquitin-protein ligase
LFDFLEKELDLFDFLIIIRILLFLQNRLSQNSELARNPPDGVSVGLGEDENIFHWDLLIVGPPDTLYEGGFFNAKLDFPPDFPNAPPVMTFKTPIWHPNGTNLSKSDILKLFVLIIFFILE